MNTKILTPSPSPKGENQNFKNVSRETFLKLEIYVQTLLKWNKSIRLIADSTEQTIWSRHIEDSIQALDYIPAEAKTVADMGAGGGIPGLPLAACLPDTQFFLIESDQRKSVFMEVAAREMGLKNVTVINKRLEQLAPLPVDMVMARALASLEKLIAFSTPLRHNRSLLLFHKGKQYAQEMEEARRFYQFETSVFPSVTAEEGALLLLSEIKNIEDKRHD